MKMAHMKPCKDEDPDQMLPGPFTLAFLVRQPVFWPAMPYYCFIINRIDFECEGI